MTNKFPFNLPEISGVLPDDDYPPDDDPWFLSKWTWLAAVLLLWTVGGLLVVGFLTQWVRWWLI